MNNEEPELYQKLKDYVSSYNFKIAPYSGTNIPEIYKMPVVGYIVIQNTKDRRDPLEVVPLAPTDDDCEFYYDPEVVTLLEGDQIAGFIPAAAKCFKVFGCFPDLSAEDLLRGDMDGYGFETVVLGYEYEGMPHLDWEEVLRDKWISHAWGKTRC